MPFNGSGTFFRIHNFEADRAALIPVTSVRVDAEFQGIAEALSLCLTRDGQSSPSGPISFPSGGYFADGTYIAPSITFINDLDLGLYRDGANNLGIGAGGARLVNFSPAEVQMVVPKLSVLKSINGGITLALKNADLTSPSSLAQIELQGGLVSGIIQTNHDDGTGNVGGMTIGTSTDFPVRLQANNIGVIDFSDTTILARKPIEATGVSPTDPALPPYTFYGDNKTGIYRPANHTIGFTIDGVLTYSMGPDGFTSGQQILVSTGVAATPSYSFVGDTDTGIWKSAADTVQIVGGGAAVATFGPAGLSVNKQLLALPGTQGAPGVAFAGDPDTGFFHQAADGTIGVTNNSIITASFAATYTAFGQQVQIGDGVPGTAAGLGFISETGMGISRLAAKTITLVVDGVDQLRVVGTVGAELVMTRYQLLAGGGYSGGTAARPAVAVGENNTGIYRNSGGIMGVAAAGAGVAYFGPNYILLGPQVLVSGSSPGFPASLAAPNLAFYTDENTGFYHPADGSIQVIANGAIRATFDNAGVDVAFRDGTQALPSVGFVNEPNTGFYRPTAGNVNFVASGVVSAIFSTAGLMLPNGTLALPALSFMLDPNTGIYRAGEDILRIVAGGAVSATFDVTRVTLPQGKLNLPAASNATPADGDIWSSGAAIFIRLGGVTKTFTIT